MDVGAMSRGRIYIAGPMRGYALDNFPAFDEAAAVLKLKGWTVISPAQLDRDEGYDPTAGDTTCPFDFTNAMLRDIAAIARCRAIALLPGWVRSAGVAVELAFAYALELDVFEYKRQGLHRLSILADDD